MGVVYLADDARLGRQVALKVISPQLAHDPEFRERFEAEARSAAAIDHPNVVPVYSAGTDGDRFYIAMRYVEGRDLRTRLRGSEPLNPEEAVEIAAGVAAALDAAHEAGLVHRDVKPANILLPSGQALVAAYLTDFGLTKGLQGGGQLTGTGQWIGTVDYVAPEQMTSGLVDARTDVYALGCVLFEMVSGAPPFTGTEMQKMWHQVNEPLPPLPSPGDPDPLDAVIARATAKDPDERFPSAGDLARAARVALDGGSADLSEHSVARGAAAAGLASVQGPDQTRTMRSPRPPGPREAATTRMRVPDPAPRRAERDGGDFSGRLAALVGGCIVLAAGLIAAALVVTAGNDDSPSQPVANRPVETVTSGAGAEGIAATASGGEDVMPGAGRPSEGGGSAAPESGVDPKAFETYAQIYYNVDIPNGWELDESNDFNGTFYQSTWHPPGDPGTTLLIDAQSPAPSVSPVASAEAVRGEASQSSGYEEHSFEATVLAGLPAARWVFDVEGVRKVDYFVNLCNAGIAVLGSTSPAAFGSIAPTFHEIASSVRGECGE
jgi:hypothetical protein